MNYSDIHSIGSLLGQGSKSIRLWITTLLLLSGAWILESTAEEDPWELFVVMNNDLLGNNTIKDDFYTFGVRIEAIHGDASIRFEENAFTDRIDGQRFDETFLTLGKQIHFGSSKDWGIWVEGGVAHIGEGFFGQHAQNALHKLTGDSAVFLDYIESGREYQPHLGGEIGKQYNLGESWTMGPHIGLNYTSGLRRNTFAGLRTIWRPVKEIGVDLVVGGRLSETDIELLEPHLKYKSFAAQVNLELPYSFILEWSLNRYGTEREHVSIGYHFGAPKDPGRHSTWYLARATP